MHFSTHPCLSLVNRTISHRDIGPGSHPCWSLFRIFHQFPASILTCKPYDANSHFSSSCHAHTMHRSGPVSRRGDASIRPLHTVQISPGYSPWFGLRLIANDVMSGPWPQTNKQTNLQTDAPSLNSYLDNKRANNLARCYTSQCSYAYFWVCFRFFVLPGQSVIYITDRADEIIWKRGLQNWRRSECEARGPESNFASRVSK